MVFRPSLCADSFRRAELCPWLVGDHPQHLGVIGVTHQGVTAQLAFPLGGLGGKDMALKSLIALDLASGSFLEPLGCAFMSFQFGHKFPCRPIACHVSLELLIQSHGLKSSLLRCRFVCLRPSE